MLNFCENTQTMIEIVCKHIWGVIEVDISYRKGETWEINQNLLFTLFIIYFVNQGRILLGATDRPVIHKSEFITASTETLQWRNGEVIEVCMVDSISIQLKTISVKARHWWIRKQTQRTLLSSEYRQRMKCHKTKKYQTLCVV